MKKNKRLSTVVTIKKKLESAGKNMTNGFNFQNVGLTGIVRNTPIDNDLGMRPTMGLGNDEAPSVGFKDVMSGLAQNLNQDMNAPEKLLKSAMAGDSDVDIHDVMTAMAKAEINVNVATQITSKVIQAYDKIMQISV